MASNSDKMTVSEKLAQSLKDSPLGALMGEDEVTELAKSAIQKAFFERSETRDRYGSTTYNEPEIIKTAKSVFCKQMDEAVKPLIEKIVASQEFQNALMTAATASIPVMLRSYGTSVADAAFSRSFEASMEQVTGMLSNIKLGI